MPKYGFAHFLLLFLKLSETALFPHFNVFVVWALRLESKYSTLVVKNLVVISEASGEADLIPPLQAYVGKVLRDMGGVS